MLSRDSGPKVCSNAPMSGKRIIGEPRRGDCSGLVGVRSGNLDVDEMPLPGLVLRLTKAGGGMRHRGETDLEEYRRSVELVKKWIATCASHTEVPGRKHSVACCCASRKNLS
jgi:hypothetical protein